MKREIFILLIILLFVISGCKNYYAEGISKNDEKAVKDMEENCNDACKKEGNFCTDNKIYKCFKAEGAKCYSAEQIEACSSNEKCTVNGCITKQDYQLSSKFNLKDYPEPFIKNGRFNDYALIVSTNGLNGEIILGADLQSGLVPYVKEKFPSPYTTRQISSVEGKNAILIGNPCTNELIAQIKNIDLGTEECDSFINEGQTILELYDNLDGENAILIIMAKDDNDYKKAGLFLKNWENNKNKFKGNKVVID